jgi:hypothetical protein
MDINKINFTFDKNKEKDIKDKSIVNIKALFDLISKDISDNKLLFKTKEHRIPLYLTLHNETIYIRYPGKESDVSRADYITNPVKLRPYDFRPEIIRADGTKIDDLSFAQI